MVLTPDSRVTHESIESAHVLLCHEQCRHELQMNSADGACMCMHTPECTCLHMHTHVTVCPCACTCTRTTAITTIHNNNNTVNQADDSGW